MLWFRFYKCISLFVLIISVPGHTSIKSAFIFYAHFNIQGEMQLLEFFSSFNYVVQIGPSLKVNPKSWFGPKRITKVAFNTHPPTNHHQHTNCWASSRKPDFKNLTVYLIFALKLTLFMISFQKSVIFISRIYTHVHLLQEWHPINKFTGAFLKMCA